ncbi:enoyl-CoA hydratase-related protein [Marinomonas sp. C2222]|uniref:Enoyl-CoA hydratase-related protein n=1 Tax=Marinomonas sargassi TaxID=2984494 RepID=A0ABT2YRV9_9GAMM|nr:enoyl-CoA hydratase-related protein [Marinomonas sargassi]MCV2402630.1 enoyl-CoA hydratase-related protein [Marinomonas sargassi]
MSLLVTEKIESGLQILCLNRVDKKNALNLEMYSLLSQALARAQENESIKATLLHGAGGNFSSGNDIDELAQPSEGMQAALTFLNALTHYKKPIIAAVEGASIGIGATLLLHCDMVISSREARFQFPFVKLGLVPEAASTYILPRLLGHLKAFEILVLGETFHANVAYDMSMVNHLCEEGEAYDLALLYAVRIASLPSFSVQTTKRLLKREVQPSLQTSLQQESILFKESLASNETQNTLKSFFLRPK